VQRPGWRFWLLPSKPAHQCDEYFEGFVDQQPKSYTSKHMCSLGGGPGGESVLGVGHKLMPMPKLCVQKIAGPRVSTLFEAIRSWTVMQC